MSDTDDTDNLLLIPPDLFVVPSDTEDITSRPYYKVVENLITQVSNLENRINIISSASESSINHSLDYIDKYNKSPNTKLMSGARKYSSLEDIPQEVFKGTAQLTPRKVGHKINSLPTTPSTRHTPKSKARHYNGKRNQNETLNEIDTFISNVKTIQKFQSARNLSVEFNKLHLMDQSEEDVPQRMSLKDINQMLENVESQQKDIEIRLKEKENQKGDVFYKEVTWQEGDNINSVPNRGMGMRECLYKEQQNYKWKLNGGKDSVQSQDTDLLDAQENVRTLTTTGIFPPQELSDSSPRNTETYSESRSLLSSDSTQTTAYQAANDQNEWNKIRSNAAQVLDTHNKLLSDNRRRSQNEKNQADSLNSHSQENEHLDNRLLQFEPSSKNALVMMSLSDLWSQQDAKQMDRSQLLNKLQEENLRRQHCEQLIQRLQTRTLELQERLAVAIQVDGAKDEAITQIHKSWEEAAAKIDSLCVKNNALEQVVSDLQTKLTQKATEAVQKIAFYEKESSKALNLAHNSQERLTVLEKENSELSNQLQSLKTMLQDLQDSYNAERENVKKLSTMLSDKENELKENKIVLADARKEIAQGKKAVEMCQTELTSMRTTQNRLERQLNEELDHIKEIEKEKKKVLMDMEGHKKIEKSLQDELNKQKEKMEHHKLELRNFYQDQVEVVVREKLREFQLQLEKAENSLQEELHNRELTVAKAAALHIQQITEKHALEIHLIEEKHKEEIKLYTLQLSKTRQQIDNLQAKLQQHQERKSHIAQQLHKVMEAQWIEALKILNSKTPVSPQEKPVVTMDQLNSLKSKSYNNVEEILFKEELTHRAGGDYRKTSSPDSLPFPVQEDPQIHQTPLTSRSAKTRQQLDQEMQKYIQMLLSKQPGHPAEENSRRDKIDLKSSDDTDNYQFQNNFDKSDCGDGLKSNKTGQRDRLGKPPWK